jgi:hypothetical protein
VVRPIGTTATDLATAFRHGPSAADVDNVHRIVRQIGQHEEPPLVAASNESDTPLWERWFAAFIDVLVEHGADKATTVAAVDRLADLFAATYLGWWEWAARRDPVLARLGLTPDQCGALVALLAGSRKYRHNGKHDSMLAAVRAATEHGHAVEGVPGPAAPARRVHRRCSAVAPTGGGCSRASDRGGVSDEYRGLVVRARRGNGSW